ncbi:MAG: sigma-54-dependent transcriptional regulator [Oligoflexales bacterium]
MKTLISDLVSESKQRQKRERVLVVDDDENIRYLYQKKLEQKGYLVEQAGSIDQVLEMVQNRHYDAILLDNYLGATTAVGNIPRIVKTTPFTKVIMLTGHGSIDIAVAALSEGASGFLVKSDHPDAIVQKFSELLRNEGDAPETSVNFAELGIIGNSPAMQKVFQQIAKIAPTDVTALISGESGTGKELVARAVHNLSSRKETGPFIALNCAAISEHLLEAELFGSTRGAYTGSSKDRKGFFETCHNGTLFLDEIGEMPHALQAKLLRVLQEREITPVGSCHPIQVNTRVIAATNRDLHKDMMTGKFRMDLFYRLSVVTLELPSLKLRSSDIPDLVKNFIVNANKKFNKSMHLPTLSLMAKLRLYPWPGNVRELANAVERAVLLSEKNELRIEDILPVAGGASRTKGAHVNAEAEKKPLSYCNAKEQFEKNYIEELLIFTKGNIAEAARISDQYRPAIYRLLKKYEIDPNSFKE